MNNYVITCCSTADMPRAFFEERKIPFICFHYLLDGVEYPDDLGLTVPFDDFFKRIEAGAMPTTTHVNPADFISFFEPFLMEGKDILHISFSSGLSGSYHSARVAQNTLAERYPNQKLHVVDSLAASAGYGLLLELAANRRDQESSSVDELCHYVEAIKLHIHHWFYSTNLTHFKRGGRISASASFFGTLLGVCPLLNVDAKGRLTPVSKVRGKNNVKQEIVSRMSAHAKDGSAYNGLCYIVHSACYEDARKMADMIESAFPQLQAPVRINNIGAVIGAHTGPGTIAVFFYGDSRLSD